MAIGSTMEILGTKMWDMAPDLLHYHKQMIDNSILLRAQFEKGESMEGVPYFMSMAADFSEKIYIGNAVKINRWYGEEMDQTDTIVNVVPVEGPIIRNGDGCSYGSKNYRDWIMAAADIPNCVGHLIYIDTPGGSAYAKNDFQQAIDYAREKKQPIIALVDGLCASAGMALASMCDEIYFVNPKDRIGCIGTMCAFYATADGVENAITHDRYVEVYGSKSEWKNKEYRDAAVGNYEELQNEVDQLNEEFWNTIKTYRPQVLEEQMHGKIYNCGEVIGTLVDGQGTMQSCIDRILGLAGVQSVTAPSGEGESAAAASDTGIHNSSVTSEPVQEMEDMQGEGEPVESPVEGSVEEETIQENNNLEDETTNEPVVPGSSEEVLASQNEEREMKEYPLIMEALGQNALVVDKENGYYMNGELCDAMEAFVAQAKQDKLTMDAKIQEVAQLNARIEELKSEHEQALNSLKEAHTKEIDTLKSEHETALQGLTEKKDGEVSELNKKLKEAQATIESLNTQMENKEAEIAELSETVVAPEVPQAPTADGVQTVNEPKFENKGVIDDNMTPEQKREALCNRMAELEKLKG